MPGDAATSCELLAISLTLPYPRYDPRRVPPPRLPDVVAAHHGDRCRKVATLAIPPLARIPVTVRLVPRQLEPWSWSR